MADDKGTVEVENKETSTATATGETVKKKRRGIFSRIWNGIFRRGADDFEKRLQCISKEEAAILTRMKHRSQNWRQMARNIILFTILFEVIAVGYAVMTARDVDLNWKIRAIRVLPIFILPGLSALAYSTIVSFIKMCDRKDQSTLEKLRAERQAKIDELKEKTNYYITQQLIQRYDPDPAAKAAAATVLASKLGADSGLKVHVGDESIFNSTAGKSNDAEIIQSGELRHRKHVRSHPSSEGSTPRQVSGEHTPHSTESEAPQNALHSQLVVNHYNPQGQAANDGGWIARIAALLVGENPADSYALICGNCRMHNGLARMEDFQFVTYYCPHCHALNRPQHSDGQVSGSTNPSSGSVKGGTKGEPISHPPPGSPTGGVPTNDHREIAGPEI